MSSVGIIANPESGRDIRRLVAHGSIFDNYEKANIVRRVLLGLEAVGVEQVWLMPDAFGIGQRALDGLRLRLRVSLLPMPTTFTAADSHLATCLMAERGVGCIITLGGDGTNRIVAKARSAVPLLPISTGTNNVFPRMIEGTVAGLAAGLVARGLAPEAVDSVPCLEIRRERGPEDMALIDAAVYDEPFVAARALWDMHKLKAVVLARVEPGSIGLSSIGAHLLAHDQEEKGLYIRTGSGGRQVLAPVAPGLVQSVPVSEYRILCPGETVVMGQSRPAVLALDGEREIELRAGERVWVRLSAAGPRVVDVRKAITAAAGAGVFLRSD
ncbi:MAG: ATP-NAD kinase [Nitrospinota bacterium]|nr:MAG: ATP-NAD kinase [Nitrospinota bacterium]